MIRYAKVRNFLFMPSTSKRLTVDFVWWVGLFVEWWIIGLVDWSNR